MEDTAAQLALENAMIRRTGQRRVGRWKSRSILDLTQAKASRATAKGYKQAGYLGLGSSLLSDVTSVSYI